MNIVPAQCDVYIIALAFLQEVVDYFYGRKLLILGFHTGSDKHILLMSMEILPVPKFSFGSDPWKAPWNYEN